MEVEIRITFKLVGFVGGRCTRGVSMPRTSLWSSWRFWETNVGGGIVGIESGDCGWCCWGGEERCAGARTVDDCGEGGSRVGGVVVGGGRRGRREEGYMRVNLRGVWVIVEGVGWAGGRSGSG